MFPPDDLLRSVAHYVERVDSTAPTPEQVDLVVELGALARAIVEHYRRVMAREPEDWSALADALGGAVKACRRQVLTVLDDVGDSGAR
ncbi:MAG: hypothetical protein GEV28_04155 [Actinophytocola sp.]|uniref:hypothetical protein n=1 Tax=Actinophytocola sp. TaxID=1872138 RepID=UPI001321387A|nr:hypothetical protein [Actinophytocola sp.]MPZ79622.1 hypothetical protein [Actinophytocola sp.]